MARSSTIGIRFAAPADELRDVLQGIAGLHLADGHRGWLRVGRQRASVCIESMECIRVVLELDPAHAVSWPVQQGLPGNLRVARSAMGLYAVADLQTSPEQLPSGFLALASGLARLTGRRPPLSHQEASPEPAVVQTALEGMGWAAGDVVVREAGWELRPRVGGRAVAVQARCAAAALHLHRPVLASLPGADGAVADQTLRCNARLRWARLTVTDRGIVAETCLPAGLIAPLHLAVAARGVAAAAHHTTSLLAVLAHSGQVASRYLDMFINPKQGSEK